MSLFDKILKKKKSANGNPGNPGTKKKKRGFLKGLKETAKNKAAAKNIAFGLPNVAEMVATQLSGSAEFKKVAAINALVADNPALKERLNEATGGSNDIQKFAQFFSSIPKSEQTNMVMQSRAESGGTPEDVEKYGANAVKIIDAVKGNDPADAKKKSITMAVAIAAGVVVVLLVVFLLVKKGGSKKNYV